MAFDEAQIEEIKAVAARGMADIERGDFVTISTSEDVAALRRRIKERAMDLLAMNEEQGEILAAKP